MRYVLFMSAVVLAVIATTGCSKGLSPSSNVAAVPGGSVSGKVQAGPVIGAMIKAYAFNGDGTQGVTVLAQTTSDSSGNYTLSLPAQSGPIVVVATGGTYTEEKCAAPPCVPGPMTIPLRVVLPNTTDGQQIAVTPITEIAAAQAVAFLTANPETSAISEAIAANQNIRDAISAATGLTVADITVPPAAPANAGITSDATRYALALTAISQMAVTAGSGATSLSMATTLANSLTVSATTFPGQTATDLGTAATTVTPPAPVTPSVSHPIFASWDAVLNSNSHPISWDLSAGSALGTPFSTVLSLTAASGSNPIGTKCSMTVTLNDDGSGISGVATIVSSTYVATSGNDSTGQAYCDVYNSAHHLTATGLDWSWASDTTAKTFTFPDGSSVLSY